jgi:hypothetical protein
MEASSKSNLDISLPHFVPSVNNSETTTVEYSEAAVDLPPPCPTPIDDKSLTLVIEESDGNLDNPPLCPFPPEKNSETVTVELNKTDLDVPSLCPLPTEKCSEKLAIDVEEGLQTLMSTDNVLSTSGTEEDSTVPPDTMATQGARLLTSATTSTSLFFELLLNFLLWF